MGAYVFLELCLVPILFIMLISSTKECLSANVYLISYSVFLGLFFFGELLCSGVFPMTYVLLGGLGAGVITFLGKLPCYGLHHWLPKAHVECMSLGSAILARILLKLGSFTILGHKVFMFFGRILCAKCLLEMWLTSDFKIWVAFSSISHITLLFCGLILFFKLGYVYYFVPHTLLSGLMFFYFSKDYYFLGSRNFYYFSSPYYLFLLIAWCGVPLFVSFIPELMLILTFFKLSLFLVSVYFFNFVVFFFVFCKMSWRSMASCWHGISFYSSDLLFFSLCVFQFWLFL